MCDIHRLKMSRMFVSAERNVVEIFMENFVIGNFFEKIYSTCKALLQSCLKIAVIILSWTRNIHHAFINSSLSSQIQVLLKTSENILSQNLHSLSINKKQARSALLDIEIVTGSLPIIYHWLRLKLTVTFTSSCNTSSSRSGSSVEQPSSSDLLCNTKYVATVALKKKCAAKWHLAQILIKNSPLNSRFSSSPHHHRCLLMICAHLMK